MSESQQVVSASDDTSFASLFEAASSTVHEHELGGEGQIVTGVIVRVMREFVVVDIGGKSEGVLPKVEFMEAAGEITVSPGDQVDVFIESRESDDGLVKISKEKADRLAKQKVEKERIEKERQKALETVEKAKGTLGDIWDQSAIASEKRTKQRGEDPVRKQFFKDYSAKRKGGKHPKDPSRFE